MPQPAVVPVQVPPPSLAGAAGLGPEVLLPDPAGQDREVARVGDVVLRESHVYQRLLSAHPKLALDAVDLLVCDVLVAQHARQFGIVVPQERVDALVAEEEQALRRQIADELGATMDLGTYVWRLFGMREDDWRAVLRLRTAQRLYQGYVIRYLALREDRVQVRFLVHKDQAQADEVVAKVRQGADFGTLALRLSEDDSRRDGGLLPPFARGSQHPVAEVAFTLQKGQVSAPFRGRWRDEER
ncbi:MAG: peptidylprolyl isomerase, partial [Planctomycetes bacterium]|nr:peptidylprolyl isomerase [Planctomycetota bacterium]